jgi:hypothetical protein
MTAKSRSVQSIKIWDVGNWSPYDTASRPRRLAPSATPAWQHKISEIQFSCRSTSITFTQKSPSALQCRTPHLQLMPSHWTPSNAHQNVSSYKKNSKTEKILSWWLCVHNELSPVSHVLWSKLYSRRYKVQCTFASSSEHDELQITSHGSRTHAARH